MSKLNSQILFLPILLVGFVLRVHGLDWDQGNHLHPDERFLTMVTTAAKLPSSFSQYLDTTNSPANPHNLGFQFYVYGTLPMHLVKLLAVGLHMDNYGGVTELGRFVSAVLDTLIMILVFLMAKKLSFGSKTALLSALTYSLLVLPIQLAHFYAADTYLVFFFCLSIYLLLFNTKKHSLLSGVVFGLSLSSKISAVVFVPILALVFVLWLMRTKKIIPVVVAGILFVFGAAVSLRLAYPYLFTGGLIPEGLNSQVLVNWKELKSYEKAGIWFPPAVQWLSAKKIVYPFENLLLWGLGMPAGAVGVMAIVYSITKIKTSKLLLIPISTVLLIFFYHGTQVAMPIRYFYALCPFLSILSGFMLADFMTKKRSILLCLLFIWPLAFSSIYSQKHSRVTASEWITKNIPPGSSLSCEHWDDCLPLGGGPGSFTWVEFPLYHPDSPQKWADMQDRLEQVDYIILSSNRLYGSISSAKQQYPLTSHYYSQLFSGQLGFTKVAEFTSRPNLPIPGLHVCITPPYISYGVVAKASQECPLPGISFVDDYADEAFTVYDHPKVIIFKKN